MPPTGHVAMSGDTLVATAGGKGCHWHLVARDRGAAQCPTVRGSLTTEKDPLLNVNSAEFETP